MKKLIAIFAKPLVSLALDLVFEVVIKDAEEKLTDPYRDFTKAFIEFNKESWKLSILSKVFKS